MASEKPLLVLGYVTTHDVILIIMKFHRNVTYLQVLFVQVVMEWWTLSVG